MSVMGLLMPVAGLIKARYRGEKAEIDSPFFKLHYRTTCTLLFISCLLVTANDLIGSTISCINDNVPGNVLNTYCWIMSTFSIPSKNKGIQGQDFPHQGVGPETNDDGDRVVHAYYQWVPFMLFLQGVMFYVPHYLWKTFEDKKMDKITSGLRGKTFNSDGRRDACENLINYLWETKGRHNTYAFKYFFCDILNFVNVIGQMYFVNTFLGGVFMTYGTEVLNFVNMEDEDRSDDGGFPKSDKMYIPQVRIIRNNHEIGRSLCAGTEHHQREDLHHPVVLVHHPRHPHCAVHCLCCGHSVPAWPEKKPGDQKGKEEQQRSCLPSDREGQYWGLVHDFPTFQKYGHYHVQHIHRGDHGEVQDKSLG